MPYLFRAATSIDDKMPCAKKNANAMHDSITNFSSVKRYGSKPVSNFSTWKTSITLFV
jgi:hypothetical protein